MNRDGLDKWCERGILGLVLAILVFGPLATGAVRTPDFLVIQALTIGVMLLWLLRIWLNPRPRLLWPPFSWLVVAFSLYAVARYLTADIEYVAREEMIRVLIYAFLFLAILNNLHRHEHLQLLTFTLIFLCMVISFYAIFQFVTGSDRVWTFLKPYHHRGSGTYISPNHLGGLLEMILPMGLAWMLVSRAKPLLKVFLGYASLVIFVAIGVTVSRGAWLATALVLAAFFSILLYHRTYRIPSAVLLLVILAAGFYFVPRTRFFQNRLKEITAKERLDDSMRFELWKPAIRLWRENFWWGVGPAHFNYRFRVYRPEIVQAEPNRVHNDYLNTLVDWGVVGGALVAAALVLLFVGAYRTWPYVRGSPGDLGTKPSNKFALVLGSTLGLLAILIHSLLDFNMHIPANAIVAITLMAMLTSCVRFTSERYWFTARMWAKVLCTLVLLSGAGYLAQQEVVRAGEYTWLERADHAPAFSPAQLQAWERAYTVEPNNFETAYTIGEAYRVQSWEGGDDYAELARKAIGWFERAIRLDPYHSSSYMRYGMCLDWLGRLDEGRAKFEKAVDLDPNGYFTTAHMGWHYVQESDYAAARTWFERSKRLQGLDNPVADSYLQIVTRKMLEDAAIPAGGRSPGP